jgi:hypothetical protein
MVAQGEPRFPSGRTRLETRRAVAIIRPWTPRRRAGGGAHERPSGVGGPRLLRADDAVTISPSAFSLRRLHLSLWLMPSDMIANVALFLPIGFLSRSLGDRSNRRLRCDVIWPGPIGERSGFWTCHR